MLGLDGVLKDIRFRLVWPECPYVQFATAACVISTERFIVGGTNDRERDRSQVSIGLIPPFSGLPYPPFYRPRGSRDYRWEKEEKLEVEKVLRRCRVFLFP